MDKILENCPVICAVRTSDDFDAALKSPSEIIFCLSSDIFSLAEKIKSCHEHDKKIFIHLDFCDGLSKDSYGVKFVKNIDADGIITTKNTIVSAARNIGICAVQRFFIIDSLSVNTALDIIRHTKPDMVELMPGIITSAIKKFSKCGVPIIAGGLIQTKDEIMQALKSGANAISTAKKELWYL